MKSKFPAITPLRLVVVAIMVSIVTPLIWAIWWVPFSERSTALRGLISPSLWEFWPLVIFPAGLAFATYWMFRHGMMKHTGPIESHPHSRYDYPEYWAAVEKGHIKPPTE